MCGTAIWNNMPIGVMPSLFFCRRILHHARTTVLRVVSPRTSLVSGDKCIWPTTFIKYANNQNGTTFALRRLAPSLGIQPASIQLDVNEDSSSTYSNNGGSGRSGGTGETGETGETKSSASENDFAIVSIQVVHQGREETIQIQQSNAIVTELQNKIQETFGVLVSNQKFQRLKKRETLATFLKKEVDKEMNQVKSKKEISKLFVMGKVEYPLDHFPIMHVGTHKSYRNSNEISEDETKDGDDDNNKIKTCELPPWIMKLFDLQENDLIEVERLMLPSASKIQVRLPSELSSLDQPMSAQAQHEIQQQLSLHFDTLTERIDIPIQWKNATVYVPIVALFTEEYGSERRVDAVNIRKGDVVRDIPLEFVSKNVPKSVSKKEDVDGGGNDNDGNKKQEETKSVSIASNNSSRSVSEKLATLLSLAQHTSFERGSNERRFMERVTDYLEQSDPSINWLETFEQVLNGEVDMFKFIDEYESTRLLDPLSRMEEVTPKMMKIISAPEVGAEVGQQVSYPMIPGKVSYNLVFHYNNVI